MILKHKIVEINWNILITMHIVAYIFQNNTFEYFIIITKNIKDENAFNNKILLILWIFLFDMCIILYYLY